jgi:putative ABC transport system permease protein
MNNLINDIKYAFRQLVKCPGISMVAILALAFGIGVLTLLFGIVNSLLLRPLPFEDSKRIFVLERVDPKNQQRCPFWTAEWPAVKKATQSFEAIAGFSWFDYAELTGPGLSNRRYRSSMASVSLLEVLRVSPFMGRWFESEEEQPGSPRLVVLSYRSWKRDFLGDENIIGRVVHMDGQPATIIGIMPDGFHFPINQDLWTNLKWDRLLAHEFTPIGRLKPDVSLKSTRAELEVLGPRWAQLLVQHFSNSMEEIKKRMRNRDASETEHLLAQAKQYENYTLVRPRNFFDYFYYNEKIWTTWAFPALGFCVLLIACANVASLLCARASGRLRQLAVCAALGATRWRLISQMLCESLLLATAGAFCGLLLSLWGGRLLSFYLSQQHDQPFWFRLVHDWRVFAFAVFALAFAGIASGLIPSLRSTRLDVNRILKGGDFSGSGLRIGRLNRWLVVGEVALSLPLIFVAGAMTKATVSVRYSFPVNEPDHVLIARIDPLSSANTKISDGPEFYQSLFQRLQELPGVQSMALSERIIGYKGRTNQIELHEKQAESQANLPNAFVEIISSQYFNTLKVNILQGRDFVETDTASSTQVAIINETFARKYWPGQNALNKSFRCPKSGKHWLTVVGVAPDLRMQGVFNQGSDSSGFYLPHSQYPLASMTVFIRVHDNPLALAGVLRETIHELDSGWSVHSIAILSTTMKNAAGNLGILTWLFVVLAVATLLLAGIGIAGLLFFTVAQRTREFGIRLAVGATGTGVLRLVLREAAIQLILGLILGLVPAWAAARLLMGRLSQTVSPYDPVVDAVVILFICAAGFLAVYLPARRAAKIDPMEALRYE